MRLSHFCIRFAWPPQWDSMKFDEVSIEIESLFHQVCMPPQWDSMKFDEVSIEIESLFHQVCMATQVGFHEI